MLQLKELIVFQTLDDDPIIEAHVLKSQNEKVREKSSKDNPIYKKKEIYFSFL